MKVIFGSALLLAAAAVHAQDQLLPQRAAAQVQVSHRQDGRAVYVTVVNSSGMVMTSAELACVHDEPMRRKSSATGGLDPKLMPAFVATLEADSPAGASGRKNTPATPAAWPDPYVRSAPRVGVRSKVQEKVLPGKSVQVYFEVPAGQEVDHCSLDDLRGREKRWFEF